MKKIILIALLVIGLYANQDVSTTLETMKKESVKAYKDENYEKVIEIETQAFKLGRKDSSIYIASMYRYKLFDHKKAIQWYKIGVEQDNASSAYILAGLYENYEDYIQAEKYYLIADKLGDKDTPYALGLLYDNKLNNDKTAKKWFKKAFELGDPKGAYSLGYMYEDEQNYKKAEIWYLQSLDMNYTKTYYTLANMYEKHMKEYAKALAMYKKVVQRKPNKSLKSKEAIKRLEKLKND